MQAGKGFYMSVYRKILVFTLFIGASLACSSTVLFSQEGRPVFTASDSSLQVFLGGTLRTTVLISQKRPFPSGTAYLLLPLDATGTERSIDINARASALRLYIAGPQVGRFRVNGVAYAYLTSSLTGEDYGVLPAMLYAELVHSRWRFSAGQQVDVFAERLPNMVDAYFALAMSGCPGNSSRGQLRAEHFIHVPQGRLKATIAATEPVSTYISGDFRNNIADAGVPNIEWAIKFQTGEDPESWVPWSSLELALSGVRGRYRSFRNDALGNNIRVNTPRVRGLAAEYGFRVGRRLGFQGELFKGQALGNYLAGISQSVKGPADQEVRTAGYWSEMALFWKRNLQSRSGFGTERVRQADLFGSGISSNTTIYKNLIWDINASIQVGVEVNWKKTRYLPPFLDNQGFGGMFACQFKF
jgi:hypothetical protein